MFKTLDVFKAENRWIKLLNSRSYVKEFLRAILEDQKEEYPCHYIGHCFYLDRELDADIFEDDALHDVVGGAGTMEEGKQKHYQHISAYIHDHIPKARHYNLWFIGDVYKRVGKKDYGVNFACFIYLYDRHLLLTFDPSGAFSVEKKQRIVAALEYPLVNDFPCKCQLTDVDKPFSDPFSATWVLMFAHYFVAGRYRLFIEYNWSQQSMLPLKQWLYSLIYSKDSLKDWRKELSRKKMQSFAYVRVRVDDKLRLIKLLPRKKSLEDILKKQESN